MTSAHEGFEPFTDIRPGNLCLITLMGQHFLVRITEVTPETVRITFAGNDYPVEGMMVALEFHDETGFNCYHAQVAQGPRNPGDGVLLTQPRERVRTYHRGSCRVPTDLTVQVKNRAHVRHFDAELLNLSAGGALLRTVAPFDFSTTVEMIVSLPGEPPLTMAGHVVHICDVPERQQLGQRIIGIRFTTPDAAATRFITQFIWQRLHEMYTEY